MMLNEVILIFLIITPICYGTCPSLCTCKNILTKLADLGSTEFTTIKCGGSSNEISEIKELDFSSIFLTIVGLNLSGNAISTLSRDLQLPHLQKLDLSNNQISLIESDAFYNLTNLQRLDLSQNQISKIYKEMFVSLINLEKLFLAQNHITVLAAGTFDYLLGLKQLNITDNPLICDCELLWVGDWSRERNVKIGQPKCAYPENMINKSVKKLRTFLDLSACGTIPPLITLIIKPAYDQVVFEGDTLSLTCNAPFASASSKYELKWHHSMLETCDVNITNTDMQEEGLAESTVYFANITNHHMGKWTCLYDDQNGIKHNHTIEVLVLSNYTKYCMTDQTVDNKGLYAWPQLLINHTVSIPCNNGEGLAHRDCNVNATWGFANTSACSYISNITKLLQQFALLNVSLVQFSAVNATERLAMLIKEKTYPWAEISDPDDIHFIALAIQNYMRYIGEERELASLLLDVISSTMNITNAVMARAESQYGACTDIVHAAEELSFYTSNVQGHKANLAIERFPMHDGFSGVTCMWYNMVHSTQRLLHCTTTALPSLQTDTPIHAIVQIPQTLFKNNIETEGLLSQNKAHDLVVSMYEDASLFPLFPDVENEDQMRGHRAKDYYGRSTKREDMNMEITSPIVGFKLMNASITDDLLHPVITMIRPKFIGGLGGRIAVWNPITRRWQDNSTDCTISGIKSEMIIINCTKLAYVGIMQNVETGIYGARTDGARFKVSHPAVYVGSIILLGCICCAILTYMMCYPAIQMAKKTKHALINTWIAIGLLCFMYTLGIYQTEDVKLCQIVGLLIHYLSLCCLLWMVVSANNMYKWVTKTHNPVQTPEDEIPPDVPVQKPILGLYLVGWGISLIICGISGAVNLKDYAGYSQCFLSTAPALTALFVPGGILMVCLLIFFLMIRCTIRNMNPQLSEGTQATENMDLEMWETNQTNESMERHSIKSIAESDVDDVEHTPIIQLRAQVIVMCLYLCVWTCGAITVYRPLPAYLPYQEDICSIIYAVCSTVLGTFILFFYGIARSDVRAQWSMMHCYLKKSKQCCRNRSVFDTNQQNLRPPQQANSLSVTQHIPNDNRSRSGSRSSNRTNSKTNNSGIYKAGAELNGQTLQKELKNTNHGKNPNINLVVLHRQQYRSNNSMMTYPDTSTIGPEVFYNPNQMNVAKKFFKRQKQNVKRNCLELPSRRDCDSDSHVSLPLPTRDAYNGMASIIHSGSKVNNTNIHVDRSNTGIKETRHVLNPNILEDECKDNIPYKSYCTDVKPWNTDDPMKTIMNIYTNVPETLVPQHQIVSSNVSSKQGYGHRSSASEECLQSHDSEPPEMRTISQQCSLEYSSASEIAMPHTCSDQTLNTHSEITSLQETHSALCSTNEITDTESFGQYIDYLQPVKGQENKEKCLDNNMDKSLQDISEECTMHSDDINRSSTPQKLEDAGVGELDKLLQQSEGNKHDDITPHDKGNDEKETYFMAKTTYDFETCSTNASEQGFENESDIYCPNYQMSEVSIRSHGLYAPSPSSMCPNEISFSNEDVSNNESQYVNYDPCWRKTIKSNPKMGKFAPSPAFSCPDVNRDSSPVSFVSELDELYTQIKSRDKERTAHKMEAAGLDVTVNSDVTLKPCDSDSCVSEAMSEVEPQGESTV